MSKILFVFVIIVGVAGFAGLVLDVLCRAALGRSSARRISSGYRARVRRLCWLRDAGRMMAIVGMAVIIIIVAGVQCRV